MNYSPLVPLLFAAVAVGLLIFCLSWLVDRLQGGPAKRLRRAQIMAECEAERERERRLDERPKAPIVRAPDGEPGENDWLAAIELDYDFVEVGDSYDSSEQKRTHPGVMIVRIPNGDDLGFGFIRTVDRFGTGRKTFNDLHRLIAEVRRLRRGDDR